MFCLFWSFCISDAQKVQSNTIRFRLNNVPVEEILDTIPPVITILKPEINPESSFKTDVDEIDILGEVSDENEIRFVSIDKEVLLVNESGVFVTKLILSAGENEIELRAMDEFDNLQEIYINIEYIPPIITLEDRINKESTYYGLLIGINDYKDRNMEDLENPIKDAEQLYQILTEKYTFVPENVQVLKNPKRTDIIRELDLLRDKTTPNDNLLIFYAGHAYYDEEAEIGYW